VHLRNPVSPKFGQTERPAPPHTIGNCKAATWAHNKFFWWLGPRLGKKRSRSSTTVANWASPKLPAWLELLDVTWPAPAFCSMRIGRKIAERVLARPHRGPGDSGLGGGSWAIRRMKNTRQQFAPLAHLFDEPTSALDPGNGQLKSMTDVFAAGPGAREGRECGCW